MGNSKPRLRTTCDGCFLAKVKCSKARPVCSRCLIVGLFCKYSPSGVTHSAARAAQDALCPATLSEESLVELGAWNCNPLADQQLSPAIPMSTGGVGSTSVGTAAPSPYFSAAAPGPLPPPAHKYGVTGVYSQGPSSCSSPGSATAAKSGAASWFSTSVYTSSSSGGAAGLYNTTTESTAWSSPIMSPVDGGRYDLATHWPQDDPSPGGMDPYAYQSSSFSAMPYQTAMPGYELAEADILNRSLLRS
jgi:hypothetical protein